MDATASGDFSYDGHRALPTLVVIGSMKAGTSALHNHLDGHPQVTMSRPKELNFFNGPACCPGGDSSRWWVDGQWHRGLAWYSREFDPSAPARGESSPAYTSPSFPEVAARMATVLPQLRLLYIVREPFARAWSQYLHHRRDASEVRTPEVALLDPASQYLSRSRYFERLRPFLDHFQREQVHVVVQERLLRRPSEEMRRVLAHVGRPGRSRPVEAGPGGGSSGHIIASHADRSSCAISRPGRRRRGVPARVPGRLAGRMVMSMTAGVPESPRITVVVMTRNRWTYLRSSLPRHQAHVILVDNGSTDGTPAKVREHFPEVEVIELPANVGAVARNVGVRRARTPYVAFADDDSWWAPRALEQAARLMDAHPRLGLLAGRMLVGVQDRPDWICHAMEASPLPAEPDLPGPSILGFLACGAVVRRSAFLAAGGFDEVVFFMGEEERLALDLAAAGWGLAYAATSWRTTIPRRHATRLPGERGENATACSRPSCAGPGRWW